MPLVFTVNCLLTPPEVELDDNHFDYLEFGRERFETLLSVAHALGATEEAEIQLEENDDPRLAELGVYDHSFVLELTVSVPGLYGFHYYVSILESATNIARFFSGVSNVLYSFRHEKDDD